MQNDKKKLIIFFSKLSIGGMERALVDLIKKSNLRNNYDVTLYVGYVIEKSFQNDLEKLIKVKVIWPYKWNIIGKIYSYIKMSIDKLKLKNKYDLSICYSHHHKILSDLTHIASNNTICFIHGDLSKSRSKEELIKLDNNLRFKEFNKIICVSNNAKKSFLKAYPDFKGKIYAINNYIDGENIINKSKEMVDDYSFDHKTFINISRHEERSKQVSLIILATKKLIDEGYKFKVLLIGDGESHSLYENLVKDNNLENVITLLGNRINPYKYLVKSSALVFTSKFEGYGLVLDEARVLNVPIITTNVGDAELIIKDGYGLLCEDNIDSIYLNMKKYLDEGFKPKKFNYEEFNNKITKELDEVINNE